MGVTAALALALAMAASANAAPGASSAALRAEVGRLYGARHVDGALVARDVARGTTLVSFETANGANGLPLSAAKLFLAAIYFSHEHELDRSVQPDIDLVIARGSDDAGRKLALDLRRALGSKAFLADLARLGFPGCTRRRTSNCTTLSPASSDPAWADALSLGESEFRVTLEGLAAFVAIIGNDGRRGPERLIGTGPARRVQAAMLETVKTGTARNSAERLAGLGSMGGKTGSTSLGGARPFDGLFAGLIFDSSGRPRFAIAAFVRRGGFGGGAAAQISAEVGARLLQRGANAP